MAHRYVTDAIDQHLSVQKRMRKRELSGEEKTLFDKAKKCRQSSAEFIKKAEALDAEDDKAGNVQAILKAQFESLDALALETYVLATLNDEAFKHGHSTEADHHNVISDLCQLRKICVDRQITLLSKGADVAAFEDEMCWVPKEYHQQMATLLLSSFMEKNHRQKHKLALKLDVINRFGHRVSWRRHLVSEYRGSHLPMDSQEASTADEVKIDDDDSIWDPLLGVWMHQARVKAAHIVARSESDMYIRFLFGVENHAEFLMNARNGIFMATPCEEAFDRGEFIIVPTDKTDEAGHIVLQIRVLRYEFLMSKGGKRTAICQTIPNDPTSTVTWDMLHERHLTFPPGCSLRPYLRCLFHHAIGAVIRCRVLKLRGHEEIWSAFFTGSIWATPGKYLHKSMLERTWRIVTGQDAPSGFDRFSFLGLESFSPTDTRTWAAQMLRKMTVKSEEDEDDQEEEDTEDVDSNYL
jgi:hypothetical protein